VQFAQVAQAVFELTQLHIIEPAGGLFAVARDEWNGSARVEQTGRRADLLGRNLEFGGDLGINGQHKNRSIRRPPIGAGTAPKGSGILPQG
jgi:hypothetical protein